MPIGKEFRNPVFARSPIFAYIPAEDRYLFAPGEERYRFNVIGAGVNGQEHIRVTGMEGRAVIHGVYDPNPLSIMGAQGMHAQFRPGGQKLVVYDSLEAACNDPAVDGLIIATPNFSHLDVVRVAAASGKHILLEKPMATTVCDAHAIMRLAEAHPAVFQIGLQYRYKPIYVEAIHEALERKTIGDVKTITILEHRFPFLDKVKQWNKFSKYSGGTLVEKCCHYFDLMNLFAQTRPVSVYATGSAAVNFLVSASFNLCMFSPMFYEEMVLCGDDGRLKVSENEDFLPGGQPDTYMEVKCGDRKPTRTGSPCYPAFIQSSGHHGATYFEHVSFIDNIEGKQTASATAAEGFWSIVVGAAAEQSVRTGQPVLIDELLRENGLEL